MDWKALTLTPVTLVPRVSSVALAAERAPVCKAGCVNPTWGSRRRYAHAVCELTTWGAVHTLTGRFQIIHLRDNKRKEGDDYLLKKFTQIFFYIQQTFATCFTKEPSAASGHVIQAAHTAKYRSEKFFFLFFFKFYHFPSSYLKYKKDQIWHALNF